MASTAEDVYGRLLTALRRHSGVITRGVASACAKQFEALLQRAPPPVLRVTYYPAQKGRTIANHQHSDIDLVTLLPRATTAGLQVLSAGEWREIDIAEDSFVVLGGEMLELMGGPTAEVHRVVGETERVSASFFVNASPDEYLPDGRLAGTVMEERLKMVRRDIPMSRL
jgi:isopenicillin N synthase-like dioxygenase